MDHILRALLKSQEPEEHKRQLVLSIRKAAQSNNSRNAVQEIFNVSTAVILNKNDDFNIRACKDIYQEWAKYNDQALASFWTVNYLDILLEGKSRNTSNIIWLIHRSFQYLQIKAPHFNHLCKLVENRITGFARENPSYEVIVAICRLLHDFKKCIPKGDMTSQFLICIISAVSTFQAPKSDKEIRIYIRDVSNVVGLFLQHIWVNSDADCIKQGLKAIFRIISHVDENNDVNPSYALGAIVQYIPNDLITNVTKMTASNPTIKDAAMENALQRMIDWLNWPLAKNIDRWVIAFLRELAAVHKYTILINVTEQSVEKLFANLKWPVIRHSSMQVLCHMLLSFQHSPAAFHRIVQQVPKLIDQVLAENRSEQNRQFEEQMAELMHCLMHLHPGFPDLYEPVLAKIKYFPKPSSEVIRSKLAQSKWTATRSSTDFTYTYEAPKKSVTGKTGLDNLGNTCFMNSVLQSLFMCDSFRRDLLTAPPSALQGLLVKLQHVFAFLSHTQRPSYSPLSFLEASRPPWFRHRAQQDCSEFLKYLLDQLHEQEIEGVQKKRGQSITPSSSSSAPVQGTLIERTFGGKMETTYECLTCSRRSSLKESFTDIPLAFPGQDQTEQSKALAGGSGSKAETKSTARGDAKTNLKINGQNKLKSPNADKPSPVGSSASETNCDPINLEDMIDYYLKPERLEGENKYHCDTCKGLRDGTRTMKITSAPDYLILTLLRFAYNIKTHTRTKIFTDVKYPRTLLVPVWREGDSESSSKRSRRNGNGKNGSSKANDSVERETYGLCSVIVHSGLSSDCGHYYCYARHSLPVWAVDSLPLMGEEEEQLSEGELHNGVKEIDAYKSQDFLQDKWYLFNDSRVTYSSYSSFSKVTKNFAKDTAYVLCYKRIGEAELGAVQVDPHQNIQPVTIDPALRSDLREAVEKDNKLYLQEQELESRSRSLQNSNASKSPWYNWKDPDDKGGPPGSCGGGGGFGGLDSGSRFIC